MADPRHADVDGPRDRDAVLPLDPDRIRALTAVTSRGGLVVFPAETVYGIATDPDDADAVRRMAALKRRDPAKPSSVMFWSVDDALTAVDGVPAAVRRAISRLLPGPIGLIVPNPQRRFGPACGDDPSSLGIRVPLIGDPSGAPTTGAERPAHAAPPVARTSAHAAGAPPDVPAGAGISAPPVVQTSANAAGGPDPTTIAAVPAPILGGADLVLDAGERPGTPSTIVDLRGVTDATPDAWRIVRAGPVAADRIAATLAP